MWHFYVYCKVLIKLTTKKYKLRLTKGSKNLYTHIIQYMTDSLLYPLVFILYILIPKQSINYRRQVGNDKSDNLAVPQ